MRIALIEPRPPALATGNEQTVSRLATGLMRRGHHVTRFHAGSAALAEAASAADRFDVVHVYHAFRAATPLDFGVGAIRPARVVTFAGSDLPGLPMAIERRATIADEVARADAAMVALPEQQAAVEATWPSLRGRVRVVPKGVVAPSGDFALRRRLSLHGDERLALLVAGIRPVKGNLRALDWFADVVAVEPRARLVLVGAAIDADYARQVRARLACTPWAWWLGPLPGESMGGVYAAADAVLNCSDYEGLSNALLEALALCRPVVAHAVPGNREWLRDGEQALLFTDRPGFAQRCIAALRREPAVAAVAARGPPWIAAHHDPQRELDALESLYSMARERRGRSDLPAS